MEVSSRMAGYVTGWQHQLAMARLCPTTREQALVFADALETGVADADEVIAWVDGVIMDAPRPQVALCDAALMRRKPRAELASALRLAEGDEPRGAVVRGLLIERLLSSHAAGKLSAERLAHWVYQDAICDEASWGDSWSEAVRYADALDLALQGVYGNHSVEVSEMLGFLNRVVAEWLQVEGS